MSSPDRSVSKRCARCSDDGWIEIWDDEDDMILGHAECPYLDERRTEHELIDTDPANAIELRIT